MTSWAVGKRYLSLGSIRFPKSSLASVLDEIRHLVKFVAW